MEVSSDFDEGEVFSDDDILLVGQYMDPSYDYREDALYHDHYDSSSYEEDIYHEEDIYDEEDEDIYFGDGRYHDRYHGDGNQLMDPHSDIEIQYSLENDNDIELINEFNKNIELQNININNIRKYKSTYYRNLINKRTDDTCGICFSNFTGNNKVITLKCTHYFHSKCVIPWITRNKTCPTCREKII